MQFRITSILKATRCSYGAVAVEVVLLRTLALRTPACTDPPATGRLNLFAPTLEGGGVRRVRFSNEVTNLRERGKRRSQTHRGWGSLYEIE